MNIKERLVDCLCKTEINPPEQGDYGKTNLNDYIFDSLSFITFIVEVENEFEIELPDEMLLQDTLSTLNDFYDKSYDALVERLGDNDYKCGDWCPTVAELKSKIGTNVSQYLEFLIWILETAENPTEEWQKDSHNYINRLLIDHIKLTDGNGV